MKTYDCINEAETAVIAVELAESLRGGDAVAFSGGLGVGKTFFTSKACEALGVREYVASPTFAICNDYGLVPSGVHVYHFDMYRVTSEDSLYSTGYYDYLNDDSVLFIEWSENISEFLPEDCIRVKMDITGEHSRRITIEGGDGRW